MFSLCLRSCCDVKATSEKGFGQTTPRSSMLWANINHIDFHISSGLWDHQKFKLCAQFIKNNSEDGFIHVQPDKTCWQKKSIWYILMTSFYDILPSIHLWEKIVDVGWDAYLSVTNLNCLNLKAEDDGWRLEKEHYFLI